jgi:hypothetical protein
MPDLQREIQENCPDSHTALGELFISEKFRERNKDLPHIDENTTFAGHSGRGDANLTALCQQRFLLLLQSELQLIKALGFHHSLQTPLLQQGFMSLAGQRLVIAHALLFVVAHVFPFQTRPV